MSASDLGSRVATAASKEQTEYLVKGAFLHKFIQYTSWPRSAFETDESPIVVVLFGESKGLDEVSSVLDGRELHGRSVRIQRTAAIEAIRTAHVVFAVGLDAEARLRLIDHFAKQPVLLVGDEEGFAEDGGTIHFYLHDGKVRFAVNTDSMERASLKISSQLLKLARIVKDRRR